MRGSLSRLQELVAPRARQFTDFVRAQAAGEVVDAVRLREVRTALRAALRSEMRRRGLWESPPSYLGIDGWQSWSAAGADHGPLEELLDECFSFIFVDRRRSLEAQLAIKPNIDGLVFLNIQHFLHEWQKEFDPLGYRVFEIVWAAVAHCLADGTLAVIAGDGKVRNDTVLAFDAAAAPPAQPVELRAWAARVDDKLLPDLVTARGARRDEIVLELARNLITLSREGVAAFRFKELIDPIKSDVRERWAAIFSHAGGREIEVADEAAAAAWIERPGLRYEARESFRALVSCVLLALSRLDAPEKVLGYLSTLWQYLCFHSAESGEPPEAEADAPQGTPVRRRRRAGRPSDRTLAELLQIPREQLPQLFATLGRLVERCRAQPQAGAVSRLGSAGGPSA
jgi:hypothetical protein